MPWSTQHQIGSSDDTLVFFNHIPILLEVADGISHGVGILSHEYGAVGYFLAKFLQSVGMQIGFVIDVGYGAVCIVVYRPGGI